MSDKDCGAVETLTSPAFVFGKRMQPLVDEAAVVPKSRVPELMEPEQVRGLV